MFDQAFKKIEVITSSDGDTVDLLVNGVSNQGESSNKTF
jgi:hypothetical protein